MTDASIWIPSVTGTPKPHEVRLPRYLEHRHDPFSWRDMEHWCRDNCFQRYYFTPTSAYFESDEDALLFRLTWG